MINSMYKLVILRTYGDTEHAFNIVRPNVATLLPEGTEIDAKIRTFTGNSPDGNLKAFVDQGYESVSLQSNNYLSTLESLFLKQMNLQNLLTSQAESHLHYKPI